MVQPGRQRETDLADDLHPHVHGRECVGQGVRRRQFGPWRVGIVHWLDQSFHGTIIGELRAARASRLAPSASRPRAADARSDVHTSDLQSLMILSYAVFCLKIKNYMNNLIIY